VYNEYVNQFFGITENTLTLGYKAYELSNHLGNVLTTISDNYAPQPPTGGVSARVLSSQDYFPFGMVMTERSFVEKQDRKYRFGFNGKEEDFDMGEGMLDFGERPYDSRIGRWTKVDPLSDVMPASSPYSYALNNPVILIDEDGECPIIPLLLKMGSAAAVETMTQVAMNYFFDDKVQDIKQAISKVDKTDVARAALEGALPWKIPGGRLGKAGAAALGDVITNYAKHKLDGKEYSSDQMMKDFAVGFITNLGGDGMGDLVAKYGEKKVKKMLNKLGIGEYFCFVAGTKVLTDKGYKNIEEIKEGDKVWSYNEKTGKKELKPVVHIFVKETEELVKIYIEGTVIEATPDHPFFIQGTWKAAKHLARSDTLLLFDGRKVVVDSVVRISKTTKVYNFEVADNHNYYVSELQVLVHNDCKSNELFTGKGFNKAAKTDNKETVKVYRAIGEEELEQISKKGLVPNMKNGEARPKYVVELPEDGKMHLEYEGFDRTAVVEIEMLKENTKHFQKTSVGTDKAKGDTYVIPNKELNKLNHTSKISIVEKKKK
jgi:RHS repeat-associated protein